MAETGVSAPKGSLHFTGSFGVALCNANDGGWKEIYARADAALYEAKASGKNRVSVNVGRAYTTGATGQFRALKMVSSS